jgi:hypothetical protein
MSSPRLKSKLQIQAAIRLGMRDAIPVTIVRSGDEDAGAILLKLNRFDLGCTVLAQTRIGADELAWQRVTGPEPVAEAEADAYIARAVKRDPDLWVVEIEDRTARPLFAGNII